MEPAIYLIAMNYDTYFHKITSTPINSCILIVIRFQKIMQYYACSKCCCIICNIFVSIANNTTLFMQYIVCIICNTFVPITNNTTLCMQYVLIAVYFQYICGNNISDFSKYRIRKIK